MILLLLRKKKRRDERSDETEAKDKAIKAKRRAAP